MHGSKGVNNTDYCWLREWSVNLSFFKKRTVFTLWFNHVNGTAVRSSMFSKRELFVSQTHTFHSKLWCCTVFCNFHSPCFWFHPVHWQQIEKNNHKTATINKTLKLNQYMLTQSSTTSSTTVSLFTLSTLVTAVARKTKRPRSFCQKCRWQVTAKHAYILRMWLCMKWHGAWLYGVHRTCAETAAVSCGTSHVSTVSTPLRWISKKRTMKS